MNGEKFEAAAPQGDAQVIGILTQALAMARAGQIIGCAMAVVHGPGKPAIQMAGVGIGEMNTGCDMLKHKLMEAMLRPSPILRAG